jgi:hypothetical protein
MLTALNRSLTLLALHISPHLLSTNHKCIHPCLYYWSEELEEDEEYDDELDGF